MKNYRIQNWICLSEEYSHALHLLCISIFFFIFFFIFKWLFTIFHILMRINSIILPSTKPKRCWASTQNRNNIQKNSLIENEWFQPFDCNWHVAYFTFSSIDVCHSVWNLRNSIGVIAFIISYCTSSKLFQSHMLQFQLFSIFPFYFSAHFIGLRCEKMIGLPKKKSSIFFRNYFFHFSSVQFLDWILFRASQRWTLLNSGSLRSHRTFSMTT